MRTSIEQLIGELEIDSSVLGARLLAYLLERVVQGDHLELESDVMDL